MKKYMLLILTPLLFVALPALAHEGESDMSTMGTMHMGYGSFVVDGTGLFVAWVNTILIWLVLVSIIVALWKWIQK